MNPAYPISAHRLQRILDLLLDQDMDLRQITDKLHMAEPRQVAAYLDYLKSQDQAFISGWRPPKGNGHRWPIWRFGKGASKRKPKPKTSSQIMRDYWTKKKGIARTPTVPTATPFGPLFKLQESRV